MVFLIRYIKIHNILKLSANSANLVYLLSSSADLKQILLQTAAEIFLYMVANNLVNN